MTPRAPSSPRRRPQPRARRPKGNGSIYGDESGYRASIKLKTTEAPEGQLFKKRFATHEEAERWLNALVVRFRGAGALPESSVRGGLTVGAYADDWLALKRRAVAPKTAVLYEGAIDRWVKPSIGHLPLDRIGRPDIRTFVAYLGSTPGGRGKVSSHPTQMGQWRVLRTILTSAYADGLVAMIPMHRDDMPIPSRRATAPVPKSEKVIPQPDWVRILGTLGDDAEWRCTVENHRALRCSCEWMLRVATAIRQGEALTIPVKNIELTWDHSRNVSMPDEAWDNPVENEVKPLAISGGVLTLNSHAERTQWEHGCGDVKADGTFPCSRKRGNYCPQRKGGGMYAARGLKSQPDGIHRIVLEDTLARRLWHHLNILKVEKMNAPDDILFGRGAEIRTPEKDRKVWDALLLRALGEGFERHDIHGVRHTTLSLLVNGGTPLWQVSQLANHKQESTTRGYLKPDATVTAAPLAASAGAITASLRMLRGDAPVFAPQPESVPEAP